MPIIIPLDTVFALGRLTNTTEINTNKMKSTWPTPAPHVRSPTRPIFHLLALGVRVGGNASFRVRIGSARLFRYQHVGIPNAKFLGLGYCPMQTPKARGFVLQWNIGFRNVPGERAIR